MLLAILFWVILILAAIGYFIPPSRYPFAPRISGGAALVLFIIVGLRLFKVSLQ